MGGAFLTQLNIECCLARCTVPGYCSGRGELAIVKLFDGGQRSDITR